jgi:hypothetical protein
MVFLQTPNSTFTRTPGVSIAQSRLATVCSSVLLAIAILMAEHHVMCGKLILGYVPRLGLAWLRLVLN